jgi:autotransporter-associated beta strand protein
MSDQWQINPVKANESVQQYKLMRNSKIVLGALGSIFLSTALQAATLFWDPTSSGGASLGGTGTWDSSSTDWFNGTADLIWNNSNGDDAVFTDFSGTVTVATNIVAGDIYFTNATGSYLITNATGVETLTLSNANSFNIIDTGGSEHTIGALIAISTTLDKNGAGQLDLTANNGSTLTGNVVINAGDVSVDNNNGAGQNNSITVADGAALVLNGGTAGLTEYNAVTINGSGITNSGALRNLSGVTTFYGQIILGENNSVIYSDTDSALVYDGENGPITDNGNNYNLIISGNGTGNVHLGATSIGGTLFIEGPASCYADLISITPTVWKSTYVSSNATFYVEYNNSFGANANPASLMATNVIVDGGAIVSGGTYSMWANDGITVTTNGGSFTNNSGTWSTGGIYSLLNTPLTFTAVGSATIALTAASTSDVLNIGTGTLTLNGGNTKLQSGVTDVYSNLVINGSTFTFNYDSTSAQPCNLGSLPSAFSPSNIYLNGGQFHIGHSTTLQANRGIYVTSSGTTMNEVTSGGTATILSAISGPGAVTFASQNYVLGASNSYGNTTINASTVVKVGNGGTAGTLGTGNTTDNGTLTFNRTGSYTYGGIISGSGVVNNTASGIITLSGGNTYSGATTISAGTLLVNNTSGSGTGTGSVAVNSGGTLGGSGAVSGAVTVASGGTLALGLSTLTINNNLSLAGKVSVSLNKSLTPSNGMAVVSGTITGAGSITVTNLGSSALVAGDTFPLFNQAVSGGGTMTVSGGGTGVVWTNNLAVNGTISVVSVTQPTPHITLVQISNGNIIFSGTNGLDNGQYEVLSSTNVALPLNQWTILSTNSFNGTGQFSVTNPVNPAIPQLFYVLQVQ